MHQHGCTAQMCYLSVVSSRQRTFIRLKAYIYTSIHSLDEEKTIMGKYFGTDGFRGEAGIDLTADHAYKVGRFLRVYHQLLCVDTVHLDRLRMEAVRGFPAHLEASLAAGIVSVRYPLLYRFPFKLGEHDTDI